MNVFGRLTVTVTFTIREETSLGVAALCGSGTAIPSAGSRLARKRPPVVILLALATVLLVPGPANAHASFVSSVPAGGSTVGQPPAEIILNFTEEIEPSFGGVVISDATGAQIESGNPLIAGKQVKVPLAGLSAPGDYTVAYRIISGDSHPVESRFVFSFTPGAASETTSPPPSAPTSNGPQSAEVQLPKAGTVSSAGLWVARLVNYISMTLIVGLLLAGTILIKADKERREAFGMAAELSLVWALSAGFLFALALSVAAAKGLPDVLTGGLPKQFAATRFGKWVIIQAVLALALALFAWLAARSEDKVPRRICVGIVGAALLIPGLWGHAGSSKQVALALASDWAHLVAVTSWVGGLAVLALFVLNPRAEIDLVNSSHRFSKVAGLSLVVVIITGTINALMRINSVDLLFSTKWGKLVLIKLGLFGVIALLGYRNRKRMLPALAAGTKGARKAFRNMASIELVIMLLSFVAATTLASTIPSEAEAASRIQSITRPFYTDGQIQLTVEPAAVGNNRMHLYFLDLSGEPLIVTRASITLSLDRPGEEGPTLKATLRESGPGEYAIPSQRLDAAGTYSFTVTAELNGSFRGSIGTFEIR